MGDYLKIRIPDMEDSDLTAIAAMGVSLEGNTYRPHAYLDLIINQQELETLQSAGYNIEILIENLESFYASRLTDEDSGREFALGSMGGYFTPDEIIQNLDDLHNTYPDLVSAKIEIGQSVEGRPIYAVRISDNPESDEDEPEVLYTGLHHAREPAGMMAVFYLMYHLVENYGSDPEATTLVNQRQLWFIPVINVDGYQYNYENQPQGGGNQRKNRRPGCPVSTYQGVDLNRNYGWNWGFDDTGSDPNWCETTYRGTDAFSESENQVIMAFVEEHDFKLAMNFHTFGNYLIMASGDSPYNLPDEPQLSIYEDYGNEMVRYNGYEFGSAMQTVNYPTNGDSDAWMFNVHGIYAFTPELGGNSDGYWAPTNRIMPLVEENLYPNLFAAWMAGAAYVNNIYFDSGIFMPGESYLLGLSILNRGLGTAASNVEVSLTVDGPAGLELEPLSLPPIVSRDTADLGLFIEFEVDPQTPAGLPIHFIVETSDDQGYSFIDTVTVITGLPVQIFSDDAENGTENWLFDEWGLTNDAFTGEYAFTDSPDGEYEPQSDNGMYLIEPINLLTSVQAQLRYDVKWDIEAGWDFAQVFASTDNQNWNSLQSAHMSVGAGQGMQPNNEFGYDGQSDWVQDSIDLSDYIGNTQVWLKFGFKSDNYVEGDGISFDNLEVISYDQMMTPGDVDSNGLIDILDIVIMVNIILGTHPDPDPIQLILGDLNNDGVVNILDVIQAVNIILGNS